MTREGTMQSSDKDPYRDLREEVGKLCARFPGEYWRKLDQARAYPTEFVHAQIGRAHV